MDSEEVKGNNHTGAAAAAEELKQIVKPLHLQA